MQGTITPDAIKWFYPIALRMAKTQWSFGHSECNRVKFTGFKGQIQWFCYPNKK